MNTAGLTASHDPSTALGMTAGRKMARSVGPHESSEAPDGGNSKSNDEGQTDHALRGCVFAPSLEHSHHSNDEEKNRACAKNFPPHVLTS